MGKFHLKIEKNNVFLIILLMLQILNMIYWGDQKAGYHMDEIFSYMASNFQESEKLTLSATSDFAENWHDSSYFYESYTVSENDRFNYENVYYKQTLDVHPPLFYFGVHTMSSLFPNEFSKWFGIVLNILYFVVTVVVLYLLGNRMYFKGWKNGGLLLACAYGFSAAAISSVVFIRMYAMMTMWTVFACYFHMRIYEESDRLCWKIAAGCTLLLGLLTQYYFIIIQFFISAFCFLHYCFNKKWKNAFIYAISMFSGIAGAVLFYPAMIKHIFSGYRGTQAVENLVKSTGNLEIMLKKINNLVFDSKGWLFLFLLIVGIIICLKKKDLFSDLKGKTTVLILGTMIFGLCGYVFVVSKIAPYTDVRYILCIIPLLIVIYSWIISYVLGTLFQNKKWSTLIAVVLVLMISILSYKDGQVQYLYNKNKVKLDSSDCDVVVIYDKRLLWKLNSELIFELEKFPRVYFLSEDSIENFSFLVEECSDEFAIIMDNGLIESVDMERINLATLQEISNFNFILPCGHNYKIYYFSQE